MNWIMKAFADAYTTALFDAPKAPSQRNAERIRRTCARERMAPPPPRR